MKNKRKFWIGFSISLLVHGILIGSFFSFQNKPKNTQLHQKHSTSMALSLSAFQKSQIEPAETKTKESELIQKTEVLKKPSYHHKKEKQMVIKESATTTATKAADTIATHQEEDYDIQSETLAHQKSSPNIEVKDTFLSEIQVIIEKHKTYPKWARKMHIEGTVLLEFEITQEGKLLWSKVLVTSGNTALDEHALSVLQKASEEFPNPPIKKIIKVPMGYKFL